MQHSSSVQICFQCAYACQAEMTNCTKATLVSIPAVPNSQFVLKLLTSNCIPKCTASNVRNSELLAWFKMGGIYKGNHMSEDFFVILYLPLEYCHTSISDPSYNYKGKSKTQGK